MTPPSGCVHPPPVEHPGYWARPIQAGPPDSGNDGQGQTRDFFPGEANGREKKLFH